MITIILSPSVVERMGLLGMSIEVTGVVTTVTPTINYK